MNMDETRLPKNTESEAGILLPDGTIADSNLNEVVTERKIERKYEDEEYTSVIIKRTDETRRHPDDTLEHVIEEGLEQLE